MGCYGMGYKGKEGEHGRPKLGRGNPGVSSLFHEFKTQSEGTAAGLSSLPSTSAVLVLRKDVPE